MARTPEEREALIDKILDEYEGAVDKYNRDQWNSAYGEKLGGYADKMKALKGDDYDIMNESYDEYNSSYKDMSPDEYIGKCTEYMDDLFERLKAAVAEGDVEEVAEVTEEIKEEAEDEAVSEEEPGKDPTEETNDPEVAEEITEDATSDELLKESSDDKTVAEEQTTDESTPDEEDDKSEDNSQKRMGDAMKKLGNTGSSLKVEQSATKGKNDELADFANSVRSVKAKYGA